MIEVSNSFNDLLKKWDKVAESHCKFSVEEFLDEDEKIPTGETLFNSEIIELVKGKEEELIMIRLMK